MNQLQRYPHPAALPLPQLLAKCTIRRGRRGGPGGQHRNKVETAVEITHTPSKVRGEASERRSQEQNRRKALFRLRINLALAIRHPRENISQPSNLWRQRCRGGRLTISSTHDDVPALLAEALDLLSELQMNVKKTAEFSGVSSSQLIRFFKLEPRALKHINDYRGAMKLSPLR